MIKRETADNYRLATCICCGRQYETTLMDIRLVQEGRKEALCSDCEGGYDEPFDKGE